ncbi:hypothetical protein Q31b_32650 [Novipirellula aureliae]|uniref:Uncharacterized protein n=1 Tax=Novipirellula aureliae TaxID=2527966 RepID=A0A5C6DYJ3_9BACT|nr:hypothetical protein [Novipirellula aureliae]TWU39949.1 hypothetical protein Q31b_32650 [Novipirellula aureliae]
MKSITSKRLLIALLAWAMTSQLFADSATEINAANALVRQGKIDEALDNYRSIVPTAEVKEELDYNVAVAQYRKGDIESAKSMFSKASTSSNAKLAAAARYNLGNCFYNDAVAAAESDKTAAIESLNQAIEHYRGSLAGNPNQVDARANIELAAELIKRLKQEQKQQEKEQQEQEQQEQEQQEQEQQEQEQQQQEQQQQEQQQQEQQEQEQQEQEQEQQDQQDQQSQSNDKEPSQQDQQSQGSESKDNNSQEEQSEQQPSSSEEQQTKEEHSNEQDRKDPQRENQAAKDEQTKSNSLDQQDSPHSQDQQQQSGEPSENQQDEMDDQPVPRGELKAASEQDADDKSNENAAVADSTVKEGLLSKEEALKMLQAVRDRDMLRRLRKEQLERSMRVPTDRDW